MADARIVGPADGHGDQGDFTLDLPGAIIVPCQASPSACHAIRDATATGRNSVVVFDLRRYQKDTIALAEAAGKRGATIVLVTDPWLSPSRASPTRC